MAEEDDATIRILQSLRGKICKLELPVTVRRLLTGSSITRVDVGAGKSEGRGVLSTARPSAEGRERQSPFIALLPCLSAAAAAGERKVSLAR